MDDDDEATTRVDPDPDGGDERAVLGQYLDYQRATVLMKTDGLARAEMGQPLAPSSLTLGGLLLHLALVEESWMQERFIGASMLAPFDGIDFDVDPEWEFRTGAAMDPAEVRERYRAACERSRLAAATAPDLDALSVMVWPDGRRFTLRWVLLHLIEETARHAGHADLLREAIDGVTGE